MATTSTDQQLLYTLRSPTTPLADKCAQASTALDAAPASATLPALVRDWALEQLLRAARSDAGTANFKNEALWSLAARTTEATPTTTLPTAPLPLFVAFVTAYSSDTSALLLLRSATAVWRKLANVALRKATVDAALDGYQKLLEASLKVFNGSGGAPTAGAEEEQRLWEDLAVNWLKPLRSVVLDAGKGGKKIPTHALSLLPTLLPLLSTLDSASPFRLALLQTFQLAVFNLENLKRGLARETYVSGGASVPSAVSMADGELFASLSALPLDAVRPTLALLPDLTRLYLSALAANSAVLFPLQAKASFATPSAHKSALEVLGLTKRRELAGRWVRSAVDYTAWAQQDEAMQVEGLPASEAIETAKASALAGVLKEVESGDMYRSGEAGESWVDVLSGIVRGAVGRLEKAQDSLMRDAAVDVLAVVARLDYAAVELDLPRALVVLARTAGESAGDASSTNAFLSYLATYHSRTVAIPALLSLLADALASTAAHPSFPRLANNLLTTHAFSDELVRAINGTVGGANAARATWESLAAPAREAALPVSAPALDADEASPSPAKKRKLSTAPASAPSLFAAAQRLRVVALFVGHVPASALVTLAEPIKAFIEEVVDVQLKDFVKAARSSTAVSEGDVATPIKKDKKSRRKSGSRAASGADGELDPVVRFGVELLEVRYTAVGRLSSEGLLNAAEDGEKWWEVRAKRRDGLRQVIEDGSGEAALTAHFELVEPTESGRAEAHAVFSSLLDRIGSPAPHQTWSSFIRGITPGELPVALVELLARRWLHLVDSLATDAQLQQLAHLLAASLSSLGQLPSTDSTFVRTSSALFRRADFWELSRLQAYFPPALRDLVTLPSLDSPERVLSSSADKKQLAALQSLQLPTVVATARLFPTIASFVPLDYLTLKLRSQLASRALALDLWLSDRNDLGDSEKTTIQVDLRRFVVFAGARVPDAVEVVSALMDRASGDASDATIALYSSSVIEPALAAFKTSSQDELVALLRSFETKPLHDLVKRAKAGNALSSRFSAREKTCLVVLESVASLPPIPSWPTEVAMANEKVVEAVTKELNKIVPPALAALQQDPLLVVEAADLVDACRIASIARDRVSLTAETTAAVDEFLQAVLSLTLAQLPVLAAQKASLEIALALLRLLSYRSTQERKLEKKLGPASFETVVACHLAFRAALGYEGSSRLASAALSEILRQLALIVERLDSAIGTSAQVYCLAAGFMDSVCGERPLLLSRFNISSVFSIVSHILRPTSGPSSNYDSKAVPASQLFQALVSTVGHVVRHRKDHVASLFPLLVTAVTGFLSILRRAGLGTLGTGPVLDEPSDGSTAPGQRAEREARITFPAWVWEAGARGIGRDEAKAVGRLLGSLTAKTTTTTASKRKGGVTAEDHLTNTSLTAPLSKHAPFLLLSYLRACVHPTCPIPSALRNELQGGWFEVMDAMGKWEREALMKGLLGEDEEAERGVLRGMWKSWEKERYRG
ncbi:hypothetical protein Rhopal_003289-T1 [Rhodotorula paludigena]|uniref:Nucleolar 27S pre-rRNA processing Urb2/Npa2 C-terminal domain-containing protein n=1 Tax=Rhodotorula paludigena TaxID=86838 RepID=A0AAV5GL89_9BASI|nr:hypothetical protein Rhopal_003289-T1 [Rhodotorula paludigena]